MGDDNLDQLLTIDMVKRDGFFVYLKGFTI